VSPDGFVQHVMNRGDHRETIFHKPADFYAFLHLVDEAACRIPMRILAYCVMRNHFHLLLWPFEGQDLPDYMQMLMNLHIQRYIRHYPPASPGHIYQGRYANSIVQTGPSLYRVARYVEANALSAGIVPRAEDYPWSSASPLAHERNRPLIAEWPEPKPANWPTILNTPTATDEWKRLQRSLRRGAPVGSDDWVARIAKTYDLEYTMRRRGRPRPSGLDYPVQD
jgi:putative transposase